MYYRIKEERRKELQDGRTLLYIADLSGYSRQYITYVFNGKMLATKESAIKILRSIADNSLSLTIRINQQGIDEVLNYFFEKM